MDRREAVDMLRGGKNGIADWNRYRTTHENIPLLEAVDLTSANLRHADLSGLGLSQSRLSEANLYRANLKGATLFGAELKRVRLRQANLESADLRGADLYGADLSNAKMSNSILSESRLVSAILVDCDLTGADMSRTLIGRTVIASDVSAVAGLQEVIHTGPSYVALDFIPGSATSHIDEFLRGCGVGDDDIQHFHARSNTPHRWHSCFISYSHKDEDFAKRLHSRMLQEKLRVWFAPEDIKAGQKIHEQIDREISRHDKLLLVLSNDSMNSPWVQTEMARAREREVNESRRILFPIRLVEFDAIRRWRCFDADTGKDMARETREYFIPDFSNWKDVESFEEAFARLLNDLKTSES